MDNAVDALKMAGSVLLFIIALSVAILSFSQAREAIDVTLKHSDRDVLDLENEYFYYVADSETTNRYVGLETIIPTIYRAYKENFRIVFDFPDDYYFYSRNDQDGEDRQINYLDLEKQMITTELASIQFLDGLIYGDYAYETGKTLDDYEYKFIVELDSSYEPLYEYINRLSDTYYIQESLGTYYQEDIANDLNIFEDSYFEGGGYTEDIENNPSSKSDVNKQQKRVITYTFIPK